MSLTPRASTSSSTRPSIPSSPVTSTLSRPHSPPDRASSRLFNLPSLVFSTPTSPTMDTDLEKASIPFIPPPPSSHRSRLVSIRKKRLLGQVVAVVGIMMLGGWWFTGQERSYPPMDVDIPLNVDNGSPLPASLANSPDAQIAPNEDSPVSTVLSSNHKPVPIDQWGTHLSSDRFLAGLAPWPPNPPIEDETTPPLSDLGHFADNVYKLGPLSLADYRDQLLEFTEVAFPKTVKSLIVKKIDSYLNTSEEGVQEPWDEGKVVWQTAPDERYSESMDVKSWQGPYMEGWKHDLVTDEEADKWIEDDFKDTRIQQLWKNLPSGILRSDTIRYLLLLMYGGIYTDTDTHILHGPGAWGQGAKLFHNGAGWITDSQRERLDAGGEVDKVLGKPSVIVGVEADVGGREDWYDWWPRPIQIVQWTMASAQYHPIALGAVMRVLHSTAQAVDWTHDHAYKIKTLKELGRHEDADNLAKVTVLDEPKDGGPLGIMAWTGPGVWTDAVLSYLRVRYGVMWTDLRGLSEPLRVGDVVILPVTGFSPGVGNFGAKSAWDHQAMVEHSFRGSWKEHHSG